MHSVKKIKVAVLFLAVILTWGTTWIAMKMAVVTIPPVLATGLRFLSATPILLILAKATASPLLFPQGHKRFQFCIFLFYFGIPFALMIYGEQYIAASTAAIIFSSMPVAILLMSFLMLNERPSGLQTTGMLIALSALYFLLHQDDNSGTMQNWKGNIALIVAVIMHSVIYTYSKKRCCKVSVLTFNTLPCFAAGILLTTTGVLLEDPTLSEFSWLSISAVMYLGIVAGVFGILCYFLLQTYTTAFKASLVFICFPVISVLLENRLTDATLTSTSWLTLSVLLLGVYLSLQGHRKEQLKPDTQR